MQVRRKIWLIPTFSAIIFVVFVISMVMVFLSSKSVSERVSSVNDIYLPIAQEVSTISANLNALQDVYEETVLLNDISALDQAQLFADRIKESIENIKVFSIYVGGIGAFDKMFADYYTVATKLSGDLMTKSLSELSIEVTKTATIRNHLELHLVDMQNQVKADFNDSFLQSQQELERVTGIVLVLVGALTALLGGGSYIVVKNLSTRMKQVVTFARDVESGNYDTTIAERSNDEFSVLMGALNSMANSIKESTDKLNVLANTDSLTGIYNRHALLQRLNEELHAVRRHAYPLCICMCDIDNFKVVNDSFGHQVGDEIIESFANCVRDALRTEDIVGRYGGDEFCVILPYTDIEKAKIAVERIRRNWENREFYSDEQVLFQVTGSFGIAEYDPSMSMENLMKESDDALYASKKAGRNRVSIAIRKPS